MAKKSRKGPFLKITSPIEKGGKAGLVGWNFPVDFNNDNSARFFPPKPKKNSKKKK